jgi:4-hydroxy-3-polyprenylbenzoate decarboxylase
MIIDARLKKHHAPELIKDKQVEERVNRLGENGRSLYGII